MKKLFLLAIFALPIFAHAGGPTVVGGIIPQYCQGSATASNNNRVPFWFWGEMSGFTPGATYHYFVALDSLNAAVSSNGAGLPYLCNPTSRTIRRILNPSMTANSGFDSLIADNTGTIRGWFGVEPTANPRFTPGTTLYAKVMLNNGTGGTTVATRLVFTSFPVTVIGFGSTSMSATQGSALYDSLNAAPKNFICLFDNIAATGRPLGIAIVENDTMSLQFTSTASFYRTRVDSMAFHWGTIIPNNLANGVRALQERKFSTSLPVDTVTDADGIWCYGTNTVNMTNGLLPLYLNSTFVLMSSATIPDTTWTGVSTTFTVNSNSPNSTYTWNYGDLGTGTGATTTHTYLTPGIVNAQVIISTGGCSDTINQTVVVELSTGIITPMPLSFQMMPNPTNGEIFITTKDNNEKMVTVINVLGETVSSQMLTGSKISIDLTGQTTGVYFISVHDTITGKTGVKKIVLQ